MYVCTGTSESRTQWPPQILDSMFRKVMNSRISLFSTTYVLVNRAYEQASFTVSLFHPPAVHGKGGSKQSSRLSATFLICPWFRAASTIVQCGQRSSTTLFGVKTISGRTVATSYIKSSHSEKYSNDDTVPWKQTQGYHHSSEDETVSPSPRCRSQVLVAAKSPWIWWGLPRKLV